GNDDTIYEEDILRDPENVKAWLNYIEYKQQNGTLTEQAFVSVTPVEPRHDWLSDGEGVRAAAQVVQAMEIGEL
ncbi:pre-mRNA-splicing factor syf1, partial [Ascosphaera atra]